MWAAPMSPCFQAAAATGRPARALPPAQLGPGLFFGEMADGVPRRGGEGPVGEGKAPHWSNRTTTCGGRSRTRRYIWLLVAP